MMMIDNGDDGKTDGDADNDSDDDIDDETWIAMVTMTARRLCTWHASKASMTSDSMD